MEVGLSLENKVSVVKESKEERGGEFETESEEKRGGEEEMVETESKEEREEETDEIEPTSASGDGEELEMEGIAKISSIRCVRLPLG